MDKVRSTFDNWALNGRSDLMEKEHAKTVLKFLQSISFKKSFSFLDVGCGNGWVIRKIAKNESCKKAIGIDKSKNMIKIAKSKIASDKEGFIQTELTSWNYIEKFDYVFSMESMYYTVPMEPAIKKVYRLLKKNGEFFCGTDFYKENTATKNWSKAMKVPLDFRSVKEWKKLFINAGFNVKTKKVKDSNNRKKWKREFGTLFIIGKK